MQESLYSRRSVSFTVSSTEKGPEDLYRLKTVTFIQYNNNRYSGIDGRREEGKKTCTCASAWRFLIAKTAAQLSQLQLHHSPKIEKHNFHYLLSDVFNTNGNLFQLGRPRNFTEQLRNENVRQRLLGVGWWRCPIKEDKTNMALSL